MGRMGGMVGVVALFAHDRVVGGGLQDSLDYQVNDSIPVNAVGMVGAD